MSSFNPKVAKNLPEKDKLKETRSRIFDLEDEAECAFCLFEVLDVPE
jgi:hypothetical protein